MSLSSKKNSATHIFNYLPIFGISILTILLLIYFGSEQFDAPIHPKQNNFLSDLYAKTLKPIFSEEKLSKEDVLNFALYNNLPVDKQENKIIEIRENEIGSEVIEVRRAEIKESTDNYNKFVQKMELNDEQVKELDSILESFKDNISNTIFSDDASTLAVDSRIGLLHRILRTEILAFTTRVKSKKGIQYASAERPLERFNRVIEKEKDKAVRDYIIFTPDTVLHSDAEFKIFSHAKLDQKNVEMIPPVIKAIPSTHKFEKGYNFPEKDITYNIDSNSIRVVLDENYFNSLGIDKFKELKTTLDSSSNKFEVSVGIPSEDELRFAISSNLPDSLNSLQFEFNLGDLGNLISKSINMPQNSNPEDWEEFGHKMDSLALKLQEIYVDSLDYMD